MELDENPYETALRELKEETGIIKQRSDLIFYNKSHKFMIYSEWIIDIKNPYIQIKNIFLV